MSDDETLTSDLPASLASASARSPPTSSVSLASTPIAGSTANPTRGPCPSPRRQRLRLTFYSRRSRGCSWAPAWRTTRSTGSGPWSICSTARPTGFPYLEAAQRRPLGDQCGSVVRSVELEPHRSRAHTSGTP